MTQVNELERLEGFVSRLLVGYTNLREKNDRLVEKLNKHDETINRLQKDLADIGQERSEIDTKITSLVQTIEQWETESSALDLDPQVTDDNSAGIQGKLFAKGSLKEQD